MKKNLRIVSAAAAALLAVAPVAASAVSVNADPVQQVVLGGNGASVVKGDVDITSSVSAVTKPDTTVIDNTTGAVSQYNWDGTMSGTITASYNGQSYTGNLTPDAKDVTVWDSKDQPLQKLNGRWGLEPGGKYNVSVANVTFNFGPANANKKGLTLTSSKGVLFRNAAKKTWEKSMTVSTDKNGVTDPVTVLLPLSVANTANTRSVEFFEKATGNVVTSGNVELNANSNSVLNVNALMNAINNKYGAHQYEYSNQAVNAKITTTVSDLKAELAKEGMPVDANGNFTANKSFTVTLNAKSGDNAYTNSMVVTVNVPNGKAAAQPQETTKTVTIMHISTVYDKNGKATTEPALRAYDTYSVVSEPVTINGAKFYKLAGKDQYIKVGNVDGTSRSLKHNSYVYKSSGKRANKKTLKKGSSVTTYGKSFMIAGHQMYRIGKNQYVKKANF